jgi:glycerophosphoryl diester phosphodiesterase
MNPGRPIEARIVESVPRTRYPARVDPTARRLLVLTAVMLGIALAGRWLTPAEHGRERPAEGVERVEGAPAPSAEPVAKPHRLDVQAHRGGAGLRPENTIVAFDEALRLGVTTLELDLGITADGAVVVAHDPYIDPERCLWADGEAIEGERGPLLRDLRLEEVKDFDCGSLNPDPARHPEPPRERVPGAPIPTLDEVFDLVRQRSARDVRFNIEIKTTPGSDDTIDVEDFVRTVIDVVRKYDMTDRTTIQAFDWQALVIAERIDPRLRMAALVARDTLGPEWNAGLQRAPAESIADLVGRLAVRIDDVAPHSQLLLEGGSSFPGGVEAVHERGMRVVPWTVNDVPTMEYLIDLGVDGIITDRPDLLIGLCRRRGIGTGV